jgi:hypothetical protein
VVTGDGLALWLVITGSALGTGIVLWLLKLLIDATSDTAEPEPAPKPATPAPDRPIWPAFPAPHAHTTTCTGETLHLTTLQSHRARHAKPRNAA